MSALFMTSGDLVDAAALQAALALSTLDLYVNNVNPGKNNVVGDFTLATFPGYLQQTITTVPAPIIDQMNGGISLVLPSNLFVYTSPGAGQVVYGWILRTAGGVLVSAGSFANPVNMLVNGDAIPLQVLLNFVP